MPRMLDARPPLSPIALSMGEPSGIGTEIALKAWSILRDSGSVFCLMHDQDEVSRVAASLDVPSRIIKKRGRSFATRFRFCR